MRAIDWVMAFGRIVSSVRKGTLGAILADIATHEDDDGNPIGGQKDSKWYGALGFYGRPDPKDDDGVMCEALCAKQGDGMCVVAVRDLRAMRRANPAEGQWGIAHYGGGFFDLSWAKDKVGTRAVVLAPLLDGDAISKSHVLSMDPGGDQPSVALQHLEGHGLLLTADKRTSMLRSWNGENFISVDDDGVAFGAKGGFKMVGGAVFGDVAQAAELVRFQELSDILIEIVAALTTLNSAGPPVSGTLTASLSSLAAKIAQFNATGKARTVKASAL